MFDSTTQVEIGTGLVVSHVDSSLSRFWRIQFYYRYLIQGSIHLELLYVNIKLCLLKKLASKVEIKSLSRTEVTCGLVGDVME